MVYGKILLAQGSVQEAAEQLEAAARVAPEDANIHYQLGRAYQRLGRENFARYVRDFGFGAATGIELPGESGGLVRPTARWSALSLPTLSFGQEIGVTALQITMAAAAVANGGYLMKPLVVRRVEDAEGRLLRETKPMVVRRVLEPDTVSTLTTILQTVVREGTGKRAAVAGYAVAGKTGTTQKVDWTSCRRCRPT